MTIIDDVMTRGPVIKEYSVSRILKKFNASVHKWMESISVCVPRMYDVVDDITEIAPAIPIQLVWGGLCLFCALDTNPYK